MSNPSNHSKKRGLGEIDPVDRQSSNEEKTGENKMENFQMRDVMQGISNIQNTLANLLLRIDGQGRQLDAVTNEISGKHGIEERLENVQHQANDTMYIINDLQKKTERELSRMKDYVVRLEYCIKTQNDQITELKARSMEDNIIISGVEESRTEMGKSENLAKMISHVFSSEMNIAAETVDNLQIYKLFRMGEYDRQRKFPRPICVQFANRAHKEIVMRHIKVLKDKKSPIRVSQHQPEELRERRKHLYKVQKQYAQRNIETTLKGTKLIFTKSKLVYKDKIGSRPTAEEIINGEEVKIAITPGKTTEDNGNRFAAHAVPVDSYKQVRRSFVEVMRSDSIASASHNIFAFRFTGNDGTTHDGSDDDGEHGVGRLLLKALIDNDVKNTLVVVSRWYGNKIGPRRFKHINEVGLSAARNMSGST
ncbi:protein IMPACT homolog [Crassostrea angulata]|uniref:protein IMPACT homolog n=1 Tax=Magallana angulata TaxID=2784310 RepID=UPI0022B0EA37|nr:protein IMPACT homolog [Crassostrea angulata]